MPFCFVPRAGGGGGGGWYTNVSLVVTLHCKYTRALTFENAFCVPGGACPCLLQEHADLHQLHAAE
jgi:hypothetical protein